MHLPPPFVYPQTATEPPALVRVLSREDVLWNRRIFKAPPLNVRPPVLDAKVFTSDPRRSDRTAS